MDGKIRGAVCLLAGLFLAACQGPLQNSTLTTGSIGPVSTMASSRPQIEASTAMMAGRADVAPAGYLAFCARQPNQCADTGDTRETVALTPTLWAELERINLTVNTTITSMEDSVHYGRVDFWTIPTDGWGDCEDFVLEKRKALALAGVPRRALRIAVGRLPSGEAHAVLIVATDQGDYVLNNLHSAVVPWEKANISWIARDVPGQSGWITIGPSRFVAATQAEPLRTSRKAVLPPP